jgi:uncharacterized membrane protein YbhN (UPF0104 family)
VDQVFDAIGVFFSHLASVDLRALLFAILCHLVKLLCTSRAWRNVIAAAYPDERVRWRSIFAAYVAGVGVNAIVPARGGDVLRLYLAHRAVPGSTYTTLGSTYIVMAIVDSTVALLVFGYALTLGVLPGLSLLPDLPSFDFGWLFANPRGAAGVLFLLTVVGLALAIWLPRHVEAFRDRIGQAFAVMRTPARYLRSVALWQLGDWALRLASIWFFLDAFGVEQSLQNVLLVQVTQSLATLVPISPGGIGTEQAFLLYVFRGELPRTALLAFSVGMKTTLIAVNVAVGFTAILVTLGTVRFRRHLPSEEQLETS